MQNTPENTEPTSEEKRLQAEAKIEAMFAQARASKGSAKKPPSPAVPSKPEDTAEKHLLPEKKAAPEESILPEENSGDHQLTAEEKVEAMFAQASTLKHSSKASGSNLFATGTEVMILEFISLFIFFMCMNSPMFEVFAILAILMPPIAGIAYRITSKQYTLVESVSKCKLHIIVSALFFIGIFLTVV